MRYIIIALILFMSSNLISLGMDKDKTVIRYVVRSTVKGDTELLITAKDGSITIKREVPKPGCKRIWDKTCFDNKVYKGNMSSQRAKGLIDEILSKKLFDAPKTDQHPAPGEDSYSIGLLEEGKKPMYANLIQSRMDKDQDFKKIRNKFQSIISKYAKD